jgi:hypothetical protein
MRSDGIGKSIAMFILGLISTVFGLIIFLFILSYFPNDAVAGFASATLGAGTSILGAVPEIVEFVVARFQGR